MSTIKDKENEYKNYINEHQCNVKKAWDQIKDNKKCLEIIIKSCGTTFGLYDDMLTNTENSIQNSSLFVMMDDLIIKNHDMSKYSKEEFDAYRRHFHYLDEAERENSKDDFEKAWKHHYMTNNHHWEHWADDPDMMAMSAVIEMVCDHIAMGFKFNQPATEWYEENKKDIILGDKQRKFYESLIEEFYK